MTTTRKVIWGIFGFYLLGLILLVLIFGINTHTNNEFQPQNEFKLINWVHLGVFSINRAVVYLVHRVATDNLHDAVDLAAHARASQPDTDRGRGPVLADARQHHAREHGGLGGGEVVPVLGALFLFIWYCNLIGYLPLPTNSEHKFDLFGAQIPSFALYAATANVSVPLVLAMVTFVAFNAEGVRAHGPIGYVKSLIPAGISGPILILIVRSR